MTKIGQWLSPLSNLTTSPLLPGPCNLLEHDWLADRISADYRLSTPARVISGGVKQSRSQAFQRPSEKDQGGLQSSTTSTTKSPSTLRHKWIHLLSSLHLLKKYHGEWVDRGYRVRTVVFSWDWMKQWLLWCSVFQGQTTNRTFRQELLIRQNVVNLKK